MPYSRTSPRRRTFRKKLFDQLVPVSMLSFEIRRINADIGIMITASHNSKEYNGYKVYNSYGGQILPDEAVEIQEYIERESLFYKGNLSPLDSFMTEEIPFLMEDYQNSTNRKASSPPPCAGPTAASRSTWPTPGTSSRA